jgi:hypothetical protein
MGSRAFEEASVECALCAGPGMGLIDRGEVVAKKENTVDNVRAQCRLRGLVPTPGVDGQIAGASQGAFASLR